jgi:hypothetical protein
MNQGPRWVLFYEKNGGGKSRSPVPLKQQILPRIRSQNRNAFGAKKKEPIQEKAEGKNIVGMSL